MIIRIRFVVIFFILFSFAHIASAENIKFGVVPQQASKKIYKLWTPFLSRISKETGLDIVLESAKTIGEFQSKMLAGQFDVAYSNPLLYMIANSSIGYKAIAKEKDKKLQGIIVVRKDSNIQSIKELSGKEMVFPEHAFAATVLTQSYLSKKKIRYQSTFVLSHDAAYKFVSIGKYAASGGVMRTFESLDPVIRERLIVLKKFTGVTPHPFSVHPRVKSDDVKRIQASLVAMANDEEGRAMLKNLHFNNLQVAGDKDWNDVRKVMSSRTQAEL